jgi:alpha-beta hydrolase superfamily lysophospholipase
VARIAGFFVKNYFQPFKSLSMKWRNRAGKIGRYLLLLFVLLNVALFFHAWKLTHFTSANEPFVPVEKLNPVAQLSMLFTGMNNPKSTNDAVPKVPYQQLSLTMDDGRVLDAWNIPLAGSKGVVILFHGFRGHKSSMLAEADFMRAEGYSTFLIDFTGHGDSKGAYSTLGYHEAEEVQYTFNYVKQLYPRQGVVLLGSSMGAVAISRAVGVLGIKPDKVILEAPFGSMVQATSNRFNIAHLPSFPLSQLLVFWGGVQQGFWGFGHNPEQYAQHIKVPTLLLYGEQDRKVTMKETLRIYAQLAGPKNLHIFKNCAHGSFCENELQEWAGVVGTFLCKDTYTQNGITCANGY